MPAQTDLGDNYEIDEDSNNNFIIRHTPSGSELKFDDADTLFEFAAQARFTDDLVDSNGKTIYDFSTSTVGDGTTSADHESVSTEQIGSEHYYAGSFDGADPDARLDAALSAAVDGDSVYLENADYSATRTIGTRIRIVGTGASESPSGASFSGDLTVSVGVEFSGVSFGDSATVSITGRPVRIIGGGSINAPTFIVSQDDFIMTGAPFGGASLTFESGTSGGIVDSCSGISITDNGSNTVGDIA